MIEQPAEDLRRAAVFHRVQNLLVELCFVTDREEVQLASRLRSELNMDSLDIYELVVEVEKHFDINMPDADVERIETVQGVVDFIAGATAKK